MSDQRPLSLDRIALLASLEPERRVMLARQCKWRRFQDGEQVFDRSSDTRDVCFVVEGRVRVVNHSLTGREISFDDVDTGGFFGELSAIDGEPRSASVVALTETQIAFLAPGRFEELVLNYPRVGLMVMKRLAGIVRRSTERIMDLSTLGANNRIHAELLRLARPAGPRDNTALISPIPVHSDIAARVSTTRETVARVLSDLVRDGLLERKDNALVIRDLCRLVQMVEDVRGS